MAKSPKAIAEESMPGWKAVEENPALDSLPRGPVDSVGVDLLRLKEKYFGSNGASRDAGAKASRAAPSEASDTTFVVMEPAPNRDFSAGRKTVLVKGGKVVGSQG